MNYSSGGDDGEVLFRSVASLVLEHKLGLNFGGLPLSPEQSLYVSSQSNAASMGGGNNALFVPTSFLPTCEGVPTSSCRPHELPHYLAHLKDTLQNYHIERKVESTHLESVVRGGEGELHTVTVADESAVRGGSNVCFGMGLGSDDMHTLSKECEDHSPEDMKGLVFKYASHCSAWKNHCLSLYYNGIDQRRTREKVGKLTSSTFGVETGSHQSNWVTGETSGLESTELEGEGRMTVTTDGDAVDELLGSLSTLLTVSANCDMDQSTSASQGNFSLECARPDPGQEPSPFSPTSPQESLQPTCEGVPPSSCRPHELHSYNAHLRNILESYHIARRVEGTRLESVVRGGEGEVHTVTVAEEREVTLERLATSGAPQAVVSSQSEHPVWKSQPEPSGGIKDLAATVHVLKQEEEQDREMEELRQKVKELEGENLHLREQKDSFEKLWTESKEEVARAESSRIALGQILVEKIRLLERNTSSLQEDNAKLEKEKKDQIEQSHRVYLMVEELVKKKCSLEEDNSRLRKEGSDLMGRLSAVEKEVQQLVEKSTSLEEDNLRLRKERSDLEGRLSATEKELSEKEDAFNELRAQCAGMEQNLSEERSHHEALEMQVQELVTKNRSLEEDNSRLTKERSDHMGRLSIVEREVQQLAEKNTSVEGDNTRLRKERSDIKGRLSAMERELNEKEEALDELRALCAGMKQNLSEERSHHEALEMQVQELVIKKCSLEEDNLRLTKERNGHMGRLSIVEREVQQLVEKNTSVEGDNSRLRKERSDIKGRLSAVEKELSEKEEALDELRAQCTGLEQNLSEERFDHKALEMQVTTYRLDFEQERSDRAKAMGRFEEERESWKAELSALKAEKQEKTKELDSANLKLTTAEADRVTLLQRISSMDGRTAKGLEESGR